jgi:hypothetical protein
LSAETSSTWQKVLTIAGNRCSRCSEIGAHDRLKRAIPSRHQIRQGFRYTQLANLASPDEFALGLKIKRPKLQGAPAEVIVRANLARTGVQVVNTSANRLHCQSAPSAVPVGDVRLTDSNAATQANITYAAISTAPLWVLGWEIMTLAPVRWPEE